MCTDDRYGYRAYGRPCIDWRGVVTGTQRNSPAMIKSVAIGAWNVGFTKLTTNP